MDRLEFVKDAGSLFDRMHPKNYFNDYKVGDKVRVKTIYEYPKPLLGRWETISDTGCPLKEYYRNETFTIDETTYLLHEPNVLYVGCKTICWWFAAYEVVKAENNE